MPSRTTLLATVILALAPSLIIAAPTDLMVRADAWIPGTSHCPNSPALNYGTYTGPKGGRWRIDCNYNTKDGGYLADISPGNVDFATCIQTCGQYPDRCVRVVFVGQVDEPGPCYLKGSSGSQLVAQDKPKVATKGA